MNLAIAIGTLLILAGLFGALLGYASVRFRVQGNPLVEQVDALLPQTQCGQCGYPGVKPYAEAIVEGDKINKCPPGGDATIQSLANLLDVEPEPWMPSTVWSRKSVLPSSGKTSVLAAPSASRPARWMPLWGRPADAHGD